MDKSANKKVEIDIEAQRRSIKDLVNLVSAAAILGDETAQKVMDEAHNILTSDWDNIPAQLKTDMAQVVARMCCEKIGVPETSEQTEELG